MLKSILLLIAFSVVCCTSSKLFGASVDCAVNRFLEHLEAEQTENLDSALYQLDQEIAISSYRFDTSCLVEIYRSYAMSKGTQGNYYLVFRALWKSLLLADQAQLKREQFRVNIDIARYYGYLKRYKKAEEHFQHASVLKKELSLTNLLADSMAIDFYFYQMKMYKRRGNKDMAVKYLDSCYQHIDFNNVDQRFYYLEFERAIFLADQERYEAALDIYREMLDSIKQHNPGYQGIMYTHIGNALWNLARHEESLQAYQRGLQAIDTHQEHIDFLPYLYQRLGEIHFSQGHFKEAYLIQQKREKLGFKMYDSRSRLNNLLLNVQDDFRLYKEEEQGRSRKQAFVQLEQEQKLLLFQRILLLGALLFVGLLTVAFLQMQREKINSEKAINQQLQKQNLEKEAFLEQIAKKNQELITFSNIMSHDLKAPLRTIASFSGLIKKQIHGSFEKESILEYFNFITDATKSMTNLIEDLLVYSKVNLEESQLVSIDLNDDFSGI
ncbi:MAG: histidine kinase dimerization/phospho-acceptor domain-containing protein [Bacteroidota bacterium]